MGPVDTAALETPPDGGNGWKGLTEAPTACFSAQISSTVALNRSNSR